MLAIFTVTNWNELYDLNRSILSMIISMGIVFVISNMLLFILDLLFSKYFNWNERREKEKYNFYDWMGHPESPLNLQSIYKDTKDFSRTDFVGNCKLIKETILKEMDTLDKLRGYKRFLELQTNSPRLNTLMNASQTVIIAIITAALISLINFSNTNMSQFMISYFVAIILFVGLFKSINFYSSMIDRHRFLLLLVNECIEEQLSSNVSTNNAYFHLLN